MIDATGNYIDILGTGWFARDAYDFNAGIKKFFNWIGQSDFEIIKNSGTYKIRPVEGEGANFFLVDTKKDIPRYPQTETILRKYYLLEYRAPINYDVDLKRGDVDNSGIGVYATRIYINLENLGKIANLEVDGIIDTTRNDIEQMHGVPPLSVSPLKSRYDMTIHEGEEFFDEENGVKIKNLGKNSDGSYNLEVEYIL